MGIQSELPTEMSLALGSGEVTPLEMTNAIATLAAGGVYDAAAVRRGDRRQADAGAAGRAGAPARGRVRRHRHDAVGGHRGHRRTVAAELKIPIAGKTGTSNDARDTWFIGMTPDYAIGVWVGYDDNRADGPHETGRRDRGADLRRHLRRR